jgi:hypothetical protein
MTEHETAARALEIRFTAILDRRQMTSLLRASPQVNRARWRIWAIMSISAGVHSPNPLGAAFTPWGPIKLVTVRRGVLLLRLRYAKASLGLPTAQLSGNDLEQILSWATAAQVQTR